MTVFERQIPLFARLQTPSPFRRYHKTSWKRYMFAMVTYNVCVKMLVINVTNCLESILSSDAIMTSSVTQYILQESSVSNLLYIVSILLLTSMIGCYVHTYSTDGVTWRVWLWQVRIDQCMLRCDVQYGS